MSVKASDHVLVWFLDGFTGSEWVFILSNFYTKHKHKGPSTINVKSPLYTGKYK